MAKPILDTARLRELLHYNPLSGEFRWLVRLGTRCPIGGVAGSLTKSGYISIRIDGRPYQAHRLAWLHMRGAWPLSQIDHKNGVRNDNRIDNLRDVDGATNSQNMRSIEGAWWHSRVGKWTAGLTVRNKKHHVGYFDSKEEARAAYIDAKRRLHPGCTI